MRAHVEAFIKGGVNAKRMLDSGKYTKPEDIEYLKHVIDEGERAKKIRDEG